ncbi:YGGT family protein [Anaerocolumna jejuensis DSM 15929]|uniref:YGGT family protein n=1 Tax=Anaerocolumna jejuensis DSM 15929 TaxID=1121322 RepID=A0A1M6JVK4_9FIRM|nr:YGGT family protein [Anaerocolumna jejuensis DSM 15929]
MAHTIYTTFYVFFIVLQIILLLYMLSSWFAGGERIKSLLSLLIEPVLAPVRFILKYSIFNNPAADLSPLIGFVIILFLQDFFGKLL